MKKERKLFLFLIWELIKLYPLKKRHYGKIEIVLPSVDEEDELGELRCQLKMKN